MSGLLTGTEKINQSISRIQEMFQGQTLLDELISALFDKKN